MLCDLVMCLPAILCHLCIENDNMPRTIYSFHNGIISLQIYRKTYGQHVGFKMFMDSILLTLTRKVSVIDIAISVVLLPGGYVRASKRSLLLGGYVRASKRSLLPGGYVREVKDPFCLVAMSGK